VKWTVGVANAGAGTV